MSKQIYRGQICGHAVWTKVTQRCRFCYNLHRRTTGEPLGRRHAHYVGMSDGATWYRASCGHIVRDPYTERCQRCRGWRSRSL